MHMKHCTKFQVSTIYRFVGEVSTRFYDRQTEGQTESTKTMSPLGWGGGGIDMVILSIIFYLLYPPPILGETCFLYFLSVRPSVCPSVSLSVRKSCARFFSETADRRNLKLCTMLYYF
jgi:hypothetical protein